MKKKIILLGICIFLTGCTKVQDLKYNEIVDTFTKTSNKANTHRTGYNYYLPRNMQVTKSTLFNEIIEDNNYKYYLYVDAVSYFNKVKKEYKVNSDSIYSTGLSHDNKFGYVEINLVENNQYLVEIMYNYAKIEVIVDKENCNRALLSAVSILKSVNYNDSIIENLLGADVLNFYEEEFDIFNTQGNKNEIIIVDDDYESEEEYVIPDTDYLN